VSVVVPKRVQNLKYLFYRGIVVWRVQFFVREKKKKKNMHEDKLVLILVAIVVLNE
jgi:hypothetical protein